MTKAKKILMKDFRLTGMVIAIPFVIFLLTKGTHPFGALMVITSLMAPLVIFPICFFIRSNNFIEIISCTIITIVFWCIYWLFAWYIFDNIRAVSFLNNWDIEYSLVDGVIFLGLTGLGSIFALKMGRCTFAKLRKN